MSPRPPLGFLFSAGAAGIKASGKPDLALALALEGASAAAMFTRNQVVAAPVTVGRDHLRRERGLMRALIVNAGNANCATGKPGLKAAKSVCAGLARQLKVRDSQVFPSSTGIIGVPLPVEKIHAALPPLVSAARGDEEAFDSFATAILTTDTHKKIASQTIVVNHTEAVLAGVAKGAGMIHPNMATMLVYLFTDVAASPRELDACLKTAVDQSFNNISIDGDTSTNDTALLLASGQSGVNFKSVRDEFPAALTKVCRSLAAQIVADGEGVKHVVRLTIEQARSRAEARQIAATIANSPLVKTAWAGADPNWGRILAAIGYSGVKIDPERISIYLGQQQICRHGAACPFDAAQAHAYMSEPVYEIRISLGAGSACLEFLSCDLTAEYVHINADYST
ncbi:MAG TPA: bifunctional glutamate N-acetyltransferase/amino-acid acetyltransferase ArgJ [Candidatus Angelobacter sp.]|nr:bifunctional glutamate N-acetyltransferase/amino-acid acetyltransferase ArgJ [Candidatus Angelobacter sp.]